MVLGKTGTFLIHNLRPLEVLKLCVLSGKFGVNLKLRLLIHRIVCLCLDSNVCKTPARSICSGEDSSDMYTKSSQLGNELDSGDRK